MSGTVHFTADPHFGHRFVAGLRGFDDVADHDQHLIEKWESVVADGDQVWVLGDVAVSSPTYVLDVIRSLPGIKHLFAGNHDGCHPMHRDAHKRQERYLTTFASIQPFARRRINGTEVLLSHFPYGIRDPTEEPRYSQWRLPDEGRWLLHGHTHSPRVKYLKEIHVGVDAWDFTPVPQHQIQRIIEEDS